MTKRSRRKPMAEINVVPYIDVMLVLLVIFMVSAPLMTRGIKVDLPDATSDTMSSDPDEVMLIITIKADSTYYINVGEEDTPIALSRIQASATKIIQANPRIKVLVEGDQSLPYGAVIDVMNVLQTAGAKQVGLITEPPSA